MTRPPHAAFSRAILSPVIRHLATVLCILLLCTPVQAEKIIDIDITDATIKKISFAVPWFVNKAQPDQTSQSAREMATLLSRALEFHGFIDVLPADSYGGGQQQNWQSLGVNYVIKGHYLLERNRLMLELRLLDGRSGRMILGKRFRDKIGRREKMLLKFCDEVIYKVSGTRGVSSSEICFVADTSGHKEIYLADVLGDHIRQITYHNYLAVAPRLSPDATKIVYTSYHRGNPNLYLIDFKKSSKLTRAISRRPGINYAPAWAPDGKSMVLTLSKDGNPDLYRINLEGKILSRLTKNSGINVSPCFSPDGWKLAYVSDRSGEPQIYIMDLRTGHSRRLTFEGVENTTPSWSPDGRWIAYTAKIEGTHHIFKMPAEGYGRPIQLTAAWGSHESPSWSPDSRQIVFTRIRNNSSQLCVMRHDGRQFRVLYKMAGNLSSPQWSRRLNFY